MGRDSPGKSSVSFDFRSHNRSRKSGIRRPCERERRGKRDGNDPETRMPTLAGARRGRQQLTSLPGPYYCRLIGPHASSAKREARQQSTHPALRFRAIFCRADVFANIRFAGAFWDGPWGYLKERVRRSRSFVQIIFLCRNCIAVKQQIRLAFTPILQAIIVSILCI